MSSVRSAIMTGRGGQGTKLANQILAWAAASDGFSPLHYSVYDGLIRGGDIASTFVLSDTDPGPPIRAQFDVMVALHLSWFDRYYPKVRSGGHLYYDPSYVATDRPTRKDVVHHPVRFGHVATAAGDGRAANMVAAGLLACHWSAPSLEALERAIGEVVPPHRSDRLKTNIAALRAGWDVLATSALSGGAGE